MAEKFKVLSLFAGIGGFDLGLERTGGFETVAFCEFDPKAQAVLRKHWPKVPIYNDVRTLTAKQLTADGIAVDVICGGFPCQDISSAGHRVGIEGKRSGLWSEMVRLVGEIRPSYLIVENVAALLNRGLDCVLGDLAARGYDAWWDCIPASAVGAPHRRDRIWIVAHPNGINGRTGNVEGWRNKLHRLEARDRISAMADASSERRSRGGSRNKRRNDNPASKQQLRPELSGDGSGTGAPVMAHTEGNGREQRSENAGGCGSRAGPRQECGPGNSRWWWISEPDVGRVAHGVPGRVDRLKQLGNAVVPQIPELIGRAILAAEAA